MVIHIRQLLKQFSAHNNFTQLLQDIDRILKTKISTDLHFMSVGTKYTQIVSATNTKLKVL